MATYNTLVYSCKTTSLKIFTTSWGYFTRTCRLLGICNEFPHVSLVGLYGEGFFILACSQNKKILKIPDCFIPQMYLAIVIHSNQESELINNPLRYTTFNYHHPSNYPQSHINPSSRCVVEMSSRNPKNFITKIIGTNPELIHENSNRTNRSRKPTGSFVESIHLWNHCCSSTIHPEIQACPCGKI